MIVVYHDIPTGTVVHVQEHSNTGFLAVHRDEHAPFIAPDIENPGRASIFSAERFCTLTPSCFSETVKGGRVSCRNVQSGRIIANILDINDVMSGINITIGTPRQALLVAAPSRGHENA